LILPQVVASTAVAPQSPQSTGLAPIKPQLPECVGTHGESLQRPRSAGGSAEQGVRSEVAGDPELAGEAADPVDTRVPEDVAAREVGESASFHATPSPMRPMATMLRSIVPVAGAESSLTTTPRFCPAFRGKCLALSGLELVLRC